MTAERCSHPLDCAAYANPPSQTWPILLGFAASQYYPGKKDHHKRVTTENPARPSRNRMTARVNDER